MEDAVYGLIGLIVWCLIAYLINFWYRRRQKRKDGVTKESTSNKKKLSNIS